MGLFICTRMGGLGFLLWLMTVSMAWAQNFSFDHLTIDQGLSNNTIYSIGEDQDGFMWFGSRDGLNRYDGYEFQVFKQDPADSLSLTSNNVQALFQHPNGDLWVGLRTGGLSILDRATQRFRTHPFAGQVYPDWNAVSIQSIFMDSRGDIWLGTFGQGVVRLPNGSDRLDYFAADAAKTNRRLAVNFCFSFAEDADGNIWMGTSDDQIHCYRRSADSVVVVQPDASQNWDLFSFRKSLLYQDGVLWIGTEGNGLFFYDVGQGRFLGHVLEKTLIKDVEAYEGMVLIATDGDGLFVADSSFRIIQHIKFLPNLINSLNTNACYDIFVDSRKNVWVGTFNGGVNVFKANKAEFLTYVQTPGVIDAPGNQSVLCFLEDGNGHIWMGKDGGGLLRFDPNTHTYQTYEAVPQDPGSLSSNVVTSVFEDSRGNFWVGTFSFGLDRLDRNMRVVERYRFRQDDPHSISNNNIWDIEEDRDGRLWIATLGGGLNRFDYEENRFYHYQPDPIIPNVPNRLTDWNVRVLLIDRQNNLWIGTEFGGLNRLAPDRQTITNWQKIEGEEASLQSNSILCLHEDRQGRLWVGTEGGGLHRMEPDGRTFRHFDIADGLPSNVVNAMEEDASGTFWVSTNMGIASFDPEQELFTTYDKYDGLQSNQFNPSASLSTRSGILYFGGINGVNAFDPMQISRNPFPPRVVFTDFQLLNESLPVGVFRGRKILSVPLNERPEIRLKYFENVFTIEFAALDFTNPQRNRYAYRLKGFEEEWIQSDAKRRRVAYTNLDAGTYVFQVKGSNNSGVWNETPRELVIIVRPPFWETWWFRSLMILAFLGVLALLFYYLDTKRREAHQKELMEAEQEILKLKNERLSEEVEQKNAQLSAALLQSAHKNNSLDALKKELIDLGGEVTRQKEIRQLVRKIDFELDSEDYWEQFQLNFDQVHQQFSKKLHERHPQLSPNDIRLCCLLRINMTNKEIASIQNISLGAVEKSKYRLKKKLGIDKDADLNLYILDFA